MSVGAWIVLSIIVIFFIILFCNVNRMAESNCRAAKLRGFEYGDPVPKKLVDKHGGKFYS